MRYCFALFFFLPFFAFAQSEPTPALKYEKNVTEIRFFLENKPQKTLFTLPKNRPILSMAEAKIKTLKQHLGSVKLNWEIGKNEDFYFDKIEYKDTSTQHTDYPFQKTYADIFLKSKKHEQFFSIIILYIDGEQRIQIAFKNQKSNSGAAENSYDCNTWHLPLLADESVYGGGEQFSFVRLNGHKSSFLVEEQGIGRGDNPISFFTKFKNANGSQTTTFMPMARFITSQKRQFKTFLYHYQTFDCTEKGWLHWSQFVPKKDNMTAYSPFYFVIKQHADWNIIQNMDFDIPQPAWMFRTILGLQGGTDTVLQKLKILTDAGVQPSAIWTQDWCGRRVTPFGKQLLWNWQLDTLRYPRFTAFRDGLRQKNIRLLAYINPFLAEGTTLDKEAVLNPQILVQNEKKNTPFLMEATGFKVHLLNLEHQAFIRNIVEKNLIGNGFSGWMADFGEWYPLDKNTKNTFKKHNFYPYQWAETQHEIQIGRKNPNDTLGIFMRSSTTTRPFRHTYWAGDQNTSWQKNDGLPSLVPALLSSGLSGIAINHGDIGGFTSFKKGLFEMTRSRELLYRWIELCAFTPVFRTHEGLAPDYNMQVYSDTACAKFFARFSKIHDDLHPYIMRTYRETETLQLPMVRHLMLHFPDDANVADLQYEFMLGSEILVAPVLKKGAKTVRAYLPKGSWQHFFTKKITASKGEWFVFEAPLGQPAVFWRR